MSILWTILALFIWQHFWFFAALQYRRNDLADVAWGLGFVLIAWLSLYLAPSLSPRALLVDVLVTVWGLRLAYHIGGRVRRTTEDSRYRDWRLQWGRRAALYTYLQVFLLQGFLLCVVALPILYVPTFEFQGFRWLDGLGLCVWCFGLAFEAIADAQLATFVKTKRPGQVMTSGLWRYSRHPNYFGEVTLWWGIYLIVGSAPHGWLTFMGPLAITFLILKVSGIPLLEKKYDSNPEFQIYKKQTSLFFPMPPHGGHL
jgi:steroid 5-alpha reductase family enzyme